MRKSTPLARWEGHGEVSDEIWKLSNNLLLETMKLAANGFALQLHLEGQLESTYRNMAAMADKAGLAGIV